MATTASSTSKRRNPSLGKSAITPKDFLAMNRTVSGITGVIKRLKQSLSDLEKEIKADEAGKFEFEKELAKLEAKKQTLEKRLGVNRAWTTKYDTQLGPFMNTYTSMKNDIGTIYDKAKDGHASGLTILEEEFGYHPLWKQDPDSFTAVPFRPL